MGEGQGEGQGGGTRGQVPCPIPKCDTGINFTFGSPSVLSLYYRESGRLDEHIRDIKEAMPHFNRLTKRQGSGAEYAMQAERFFNQGDFDNAEIFAQRALLKAQLGMDENIAFSAQYFQILIAFMKGALSRVMALMYKIHEDMTSSKEENFIHTVEICEGCIYAYLDQKDKIPERCNFTFWLKDFLSCWGRTL